MKHFWIAVGLLVATIVPSARAEDARPLRAGIIGLDTSHSIQFARLLNDPNPKPGLEGVRIVAAYPYGSRDIPSSRDRIEGYTKDVRDKYGVKIVDSLDALLDQVDVVFLETNDGQPRLKQAEAVLKAKKPVFIDKPVAASLVDTIRIYELAKVMGVPCFSSSSLRYSPNIAAANKDPKAGDVLGCVAFSPCALEPHHPDLYWYGIHGVESLFTVMGTGCETVARTRSDGQELVVGRWKDGRIGTFRGIREGKADYGVMVFGSKAIVPTMGYGGYEPLLTEIVKFFKTGVAPIDPEETIEIYAFMEAADESKRQGGAPVKVADVLAKARAAATSPGANDRSR